MGQGTRLLYLDDQYLRSFASKVTRSGPGFFVLEATAFYPGGGGQPPDSGRALAGDLELQVRSARTEGDEVVHELASGDVVPVGSSVLCELDWDRRYAHMRLHTAVHLIDALLARRGVDARLTGGQIYDDRARIDFEWPGLSRQMVGELEAEANEEIRRGRRVLVKYLSREEALRVPGIARTRPGEELLSRLEVVRVVEIEGLDAQMDGGTHVADLREIGGIRVTRFENKGRANKRIEIELSPSTG